MSLAIIVILIIATVIFIRDNNKRKKKAVLDSSTKYQALLGYVNSEQKKTLNGEYYFTIHKKLNVKL